MAKWIDDTRPDEPLTALARRALAARLKSAGGNLRSAAKEAHLDREHIHDLRVATRRAVAALDLFEDLLPRTRRKWLRKKLRKVRRTAGDARDLDVFDSRVEAWLGHDLASLGMVKSEIARHRRDVQPKVRRLYEKLRDKHFRKRASTLAKRVRIREDNQANGRSAGDPPIHEVARERCQPIVIRFAEASETDLHDFANLHQFRVSGKRLRYTLEIFSGALGPRFRDELYPQLIELQDQLGDINDHVSAIARLEEWSAKSADSDEQAAFDAARQRVSQLCEDCKRGFMAAWTAGRIRRFVYLLHQVLRGDSSGVANGYAAPDQSSADAEPAPEPAVGASQS